MVYDMTTMLGPRLTSAATLTGVAVWAASFGLYLATLAPTLSWGFNGLGVDGGELLAAAKTTGVAHPPGYPTYTLLLKAFATLVPIGDYAHRGNLLSAVLASLSAVLLYCAVLRFSRHLWPKAPNLVAIAGAAVGATIFATSPLFWSQATITEVYTLNAVFTGALILIASQLALRVPSEGDHAANDRTSPRMALFALLLGLGLGNHITLLAIALPLLYWLLSTLGWRKVITLWSVGALIVGLGIYVYLPISAAQEPAVSWGEADTLSGFGWLLSGRLYQQYVFGIPVGSLLSRAASQLELTFLQFNPLGIFLGLVGAVSIASGQRRFLWISLASIVALTIYSITYSTVDSEVLVIPAFLIFSIWAGIGFARVLSEVAIRRGWRATDPVKDALDRLRLPPARAAILLGLIAFGALPVTSVILNYGDQNRRNDNQAYTYAKDIFDALPDGSLVMSSTEESAFSLWYMGYVDQVERNVVPIAVPLLQFDWYWSTLRSMFPDRFPPDSPTGINQARRRIVEHNEVNAEVFFTYWDRFMDATFERDQVGRLRLYGASMRAAQQ